MVIDIVNSLVGENTFNYKRNLKQEQEFGVIFDTTWALEITSQGSKDFKFVRDSRVHYIAHLNELPTELMHHLLSTNQSLREFVNVDEDEIKNYPPVILEEDEDDVEEYCLAYREETETFYVLPTNTVCIIGGAFSLHLEFNI